MIPLARLNSTSKVPRVGSFSTKIAKFSPSLDQNHQNRVSIQELPKLDFSLAKMAKKHTLGQIRSTKKYTLAGGTSPGTFSMEEPPPPPLPPCCQQCNILILELDRQLRQRWRQGTVFQDTLRSLIEFI